MNRRKVAAIISLATVLVSSIPIQAYATPNDYECINDLAPKSDNEFRELIDEILEIKAVHPEWDEQEIEDHMDEIHGNSVERDGLIDIWNSLTESEKKLVIRYPFDALKVNNAKNTATTQTEKKFGFSGLGDRSDAFRHGIWNAEMTILIGEEKAELFATAHEDKDTTGMESDGYSKVEHKNMDLHNNAVGRVLGSENLNASEDEIANIIYNNIYQEETQFIWLHE